MGHFEAEAVTEGGGDGAIAAWNFAAIGSMVALFFVSGGVGSRPCRCESEAWEPSLLLSLTLAAAMEANGQCRLPTTPGDVKSFSIGLDCFLFRILPVETFLIRPFVEAAELERSVLDSSPESLLALKPSKCFRPS